jgi:peptidoglycan/LPS O-acetylase OafA/YrhL
MTNLRRLSAGESAQLDSVRGCSALVVAVAHANQLIVAPVFDKGAYGFGFLAQSAVMVFFVLSGFLIRKSISGNKMRNNGRFLVIEFAVDRVLRIRPPLAMSVGLLVILALAAPYAFPSGTSQFLQLEGQSPGRIGIEINYTELLGALFALNGYLTDTPRSNGPLWSLSIEVGYYLLAAVIATPSGYWKLLSTPVIAVLGWLAWNNDLFFFYAPVWWSGYGLALLHDHGKLLPRGFLIAVGSIALTLATYAGYLHVQDHTPRDSWYALVAFNLLIGAAFTTLLAQALAGTVRFPEVFKGAAPYSYTLYVVHVPLLLFIFRVSQEFISQSVPRALLIAACSSCTIVLFARYIARLVEIAPMRVALRRRPSSTGAA